MLYFLWKRFISIFTMSTDITIFEKILQNEIPYKKVYEDDKVLAFEDVNPVAPVHVLIIPKKKKIVNIALAIAEDCMILGSILIAAKKIAEIKNIHKTGYRLVFNNYKDGGQTVDYLHCHIIGGRKMSWPPG